MAQSTKVTLFDLRDGRDAIIVHLDDLGDFVHINRQRALTPDALSVRSHILRDGSCQALKIFCIKTTSCDFSCGVEHTLLAVHELGQVVPVLASLNERTAFLNEWAHRSTFKEAWDLVALIHHNRVAQKVQDLIGGQFQINGDLLSLRSQIMSLKQ